MPVHTPTAVRTVSSRIAARAQRCAESTGLSPQAFFDRTGITPGELADATARIDADRHRRMLDLVLGLGASYPWESIGPDALFMDFPVLGHLCLNAPTLREAIASFATYRPLVGGFDFFGAHHANSIVRFEYLSEFTPADSIQALFHFQCLAGLVRLYDPRTTTRFELELSGAESPSLRGIAAVFGARIRYGCAANRMQFATTSLDLPFPHYNPQLGPLLQRQAREELTRIQHLHEFSARIEGLLREQVEDPNEGPDGARLLRQICARLDISRWTLYRRLQDEGTSFREIELRVRLAESRRLLTDTHQSVAEISERMGFASQSAFTRFFRARHGMAPLAFRRKDEGTARQAC